MRPELDVAGRERHSRPTVLMLVLAPALVELAAPSGFGAVALTVSLGAGMVLARWVVEIQRTPPPARRVGDRP